MKDLSVARAIADTVDVCPDLPLLEVGPGMSVLTQYLLTKGGALKAPSIVDYRQSHEYYQPSLSPLLVKRPKAFWKTLAKDKHTF